jgi:hypothetical protein
MGFLRKDPVTHESARVYGEEETTVVHEEKSVDLEGGVLEHEEKSVDLEGGVLEHEEKSADLEGQLPRARGKICRPRVMVNFDQWSLFSTGG